MLVSIIRVFFLTYFRRIKIDLLDKSFNHHCGLSQVELMTFWRVVGDRNFNGGSGTGGATELSQSIYFLRI